MDQLTGITVDLGTIIAFLYAVVAVMLIVVLYHVLFVLVDVRKIVRRVEDVTSQVEAVILKPLSIADQAVQFAVDFLEKKKREHGKKHAHHAKVKDADEEEETDDM